MKTTSFRHALGVAFALFALIPSTVLAQDFTFLRSIGAGQVGSPYFTTLDSSNNIYIADYNNNRIQEYAHDGTFIQTIGSGGSYQNRLA